MFRVFHEGDQHPLARIPGARVAVYERYVGVEVERVPDGLRGEVLAAEVVAGHDERGAVLFEAVDGVPGVVEAAGVDEDDRTERAG